MASDGVWLLSLFLFWLRDEGLAVRTKDKIYVDISGRLACFRRLNATHQIGCASAINGNIGVVHYINSTEDYDWVVNKGPNAPYVVLLPADFFNKKSVLGLLNSGKVNGMLVIQLDGESTLLDGFSADKKCPNDGYGFYWNKTEYQHCQKVTWNPTGSGLMFEDFNIPVFLLTNDTEITYIINSCYERYNKPVDGLLRHYPLCAAQLQDEMNAAVDSVTCIRRSKHITNLNPDQYCDPLGDDNINGFINVKDSTEMLPSKSVIIAASRMDYMSLFEYMNKSADNPITSIVTLLAAANALGKIKHTIEKQPNAKTIMFTFFNGESFDYIGSSRIVHDMEHKRFPYHVTDNSTEKVHPISFEHLSHMIEVNQLGYAVNGSQVWLHSDPVSSQDANVKKEIDRLSKMMQDIGGDEKLTVNRSDFSHPLPPSSVQRFLRKTTKLPAIVLTDHQAEYANKYYNSRLDVPALIEASYPKSLNQSEWYNTVTEQARSLTKIATVLARTLYTLATEETNSSHVEASVENVTHLLYCYLFNGSCDLFHSVIDKSLLKSLNKMTVPMSLYVGVKGKVNPLTRITQRLLALYLGNEVQDAAEKNCSSYANKVYGAYWMRKAKNQNGLCVKAAIHLTPAVSPAFVIDDYDWLSGEYSSWTESVWPVNAMLVRVFLVPSHKFQIAIFSVGLVIFLLSLVIVYLINDKADILFGNYHATTY